MAGRRIEDFEFGPQDFEGEEAVGEDAGVVGEDVAVDFGRCLFEDQRPEVGDLGDGGRAFGVGGAGEGVLGAD